MACASARVLAIPELVSLVLDYLPKPRKIAVLAAVSWVWVSEVERRTFKTLNIETDQLEHFAKFCTGKRRGEVQCIRFQATIYDDLAADAGHDQFGEVLDMRTHLNKLCQRQVHNFLAILSTWPKNLNPLELQLCSYIFQGMSTRLSCGFNASLGPKVPVRVLPVADPFIRETQIPVVTRLVILRDPVVRTWPSTAGELMKLFPNVEDLRASFAEPTDVELDFSWVVPEDCTRSRTTHGTEHHPLNSRIVLPCTISSWPNSLRTVQIAQPISTTGRVRSIERFQAYPLSNPLVKLATHLETLVLWKTTLDPAQLFQLIFKNEESYPHLKEVRIGLGDSIPGGDWLFDMELTGRYSIRSIPIGYMWNSIYESAGYAATRMPRLKALSLEHDIWRGITWAQSHTFQFQVRDGMRVGSSWLESEAVATWTVGGGYRPSRDVLEAWQMAADALGVRLQTRLTDGKAIVSNLDLRV